MGDFIAVDDLSPFAQIEVVKAAAMIADAEAQASAAAPCLADPNVTLTAAQAAVVKAVLRAAILRWNDAGTGAMQSQTAGPFGVTLDTRQARRGMFLASELDQLRDLCNGGRGAGRAFTIDTVDSSAASSPDWWWLTRDHGPYPPFV